VSGLADLVTPGSMKARASTTEGRTCTRRHPVAQALSPAAPTIHRLPVLAWKATSNPPVLRAGHARACTRHHFKPAVLGALCDVFDRLSSQLASDVSSVEVSPFGPVRVGVERYLASAVPTFGDELPTIALWAKRLATRLCICSRHSRDRNSRRETRPRARRDKGGTEAPPVADRSWGGSPRS